MRGVRLQLGSSGGSRRRTQLAEDARRARAADEVDPVAIPPSGRAADGMLSAGQRGAQSTSDDRVARLRHEWTFLLSIFALASHRSCGAGRRRGWLG